MRTIPMLPRVSFALLLLAVLHPAAACLVAQSLTLDELIAAADFVGKVTVIESTPAANPWFAHVQGYEQVETRLRVLATYQGQAGGAEIAFEHYAVASGLAMPGCRQTYHFERGRTYVVFAAATEKAGVFRQLWANQNLQEDQGVVLAAGPEPRTGQPIKDVVFSELSGLLQSPSATDVKYGLAHLDLLSGGAFQGQKDFDREEVLRRVRPLLSHADNDVVLAAINVMGSSNPYMSEEYAPQWLATIRDGPHGFGLWDRARVNLGGKLYWRDLAAIVDSSAPAATRALAIRALGRADEPAIWPLVQRWATDAEPLVRRAAAVLLADFKGKVDPKLLTRLVVDQQPTVRVGAAQAIGFGQFSELIPDLGKMLADTDPGVQRAAAMSLLSFPLRDGGDVLRANVDHPQFHALFVNALAREDTARYVDELAEIIKKHQMMPKLFWSGRIPWTVSWDRLFFYVQRQPVALVRGGQFDDVLDVLESPASGDPTGPTFLSSSEPRDLYALYVQRGMADRAAKFRASTKKNVIGALDEFFERVDQNPESFQRH